MIRSSHIFHAIDAYCKKHTMLPQKSKIILGLSGGPDSMFLLHYLHAKQQDLEITVIAAHLDHEWRINSQNDAEFCAEQTKKLQIRLITAKASELSFKPKFNGSKEDLGRMLRRHFFETVKKQEDADFIALAHQMQDQQETFFIRMIRGASLAGLTAMQPRQNHYIRPLLETNRSDIINVLENNQIPYLVDPSNESDLFLRNRVRNKVLPVLRDIDTRFDSNFARTLTQLKETNDFLDELTLHTLNSISSLYENKLVLHTAQFNALHPVLQKRIIIAWLISAHVPFTPTEKFLHEIIHFLGQPSGKIHHIHATWAINKKQGLATIIK